MKRSCSFFLIALAAAAPGFSLTLHAADVAWGGGDFTWNQPDADSFGADTYQDGDSVTFGNTGITDGTTGKTAIVLSGKLTPGELTFNQTGARFGGATNSPGAVGFNYYMGSNAAANYIASTGGLTLEGGNTIFANTAGSGTFSVNHTFAGDLSYSGGVMLGLRESATTRFVTLSVGSLETPIKGNSIVFNSITSANGNSSGNAWTASSSRVIVTDSKPTVSNGMVSPGLQYYTGGNTLGLFMTFSGDNLVPVTSYGSTDINTAIDSDIVNIGSSAQAVGTTKTVHAIRLGQNLTINAGVSLTLGSGGLIMGSNTISGAGTLDFGSGPGFIGAYNAASQGEISAKIVGSGGVTVMGVSQGLRLSNNSNLFTGGLFINGGTVVLGLASATTAGATAANGNNVTVSDLGCLTVNVLGPSGATIGGLRGDGDVAPQYQLSNSNSRTITISPASDSHAFDGRIRNGASGSVLSVVKSGSGTQIFGTDSTGSYTGTTTVSAGKLVINGNFSAATGAVSVGADGTLGGTGIIGGATTVSGTLAAGNSTGLLTFNSTLALAGGAAFEIHGTARGAAVGGYDAVDVGGALTYGGTLTALFGTSFGAGSYNFDLFDFDGQSGTLDSLGIAGSYSGTLNPDNGWALTSGTESWGFNHSTGVLSLTVVPEPGVALLGGLGLVALLRRRRRDWA